MCTWKYVGPECFDEDMYDTYCVYPNRVAMLPEQKVILSNICEEKKPRIPLYVCTMNNSMIAEKGQGKMVGALILFLC